MGDERIIQVPGCDDCRGLRHDKNTVRTRSQQVAKLVGGRCQAIAKLVREWCQADRENGEEKVQHTIAELVKGNCDDFHPPLRGPRKREFPFLSSLKKENTASKI